MRVNHLEKSTLQKAERRMKKKRPKMRMSGKRTRDITRLWRTRRLPKVT